MGFRFRLKAYTPLSRWSVYSTTLVAGQTPCFSPLFVPLFPPTPSKATNGSVNMISTRIFTLKYAIQPRSRSTLHSSAKAGIAVGVIFTVFIALATGFIILRRRRRGSRSTQSLSNPHPIMAETKIPPSSPPPAFSPGAFFKSRLSQKFYHSNEKETMARRKFTEVIAPPDHVAEMPSPTEGHADHARGDEIFTRPLPPSMSPAPSELPGESLHTTSPGPMQLPVVQSRLPLTPQPEELPGDTWMDEHHPAFQPKPEAEIQMEDAQSTDENQYTEAISPLLVSPATPSVSPMTPLGSTFDSALRNSSG